MRPTPALLKLAACLTSLAPLASAWPGWLPRPELDSLLVREQIEDDADVPVATAAPDSDYGYLRVRQQDQDGPVETTPPNAKESTGDSTITDGPIPTDEPTDKKQGNGDGGNGNELNTARIETGSSSGKGTKTKTSTRATFDPVGAAGGVKMITPDPFAAPTPLYKIGDYITWGWNYTGVQAEPTAVDVLVSCASRTATWTLSGNMTFETAVPKFVWDSSVQANDVENPLGNDVYTLVIKDSEAEITDRPEAGYLTSWQGFTFGLYKAKEYKPLSEWECVTCNSAASGLDTKAFKLAAGMSVVTILSFTWFVAGLGVF